MNDERDRVLKLLEEKKITAEEAAKLLDAIKRSEGGGDKRNRFLKVRVFPKGSDKPKVNNPVSIFVITTSVPDLLLQTLAGHHRQQKS